MRLPVSLLAGLVLSAAPAAQTSISWDGDASALRGGSEAVVVVCPAAGASERGHAVWGSNPYTDDSSVCRAAVHAGAIGWGGGRVTIAPRPGQASYRGTTRNGVETSNYGSWGGSFVVVVSPVAIGWDTAVVELRGTSGRVEMECPPVRDAADRSHAVWGSGPYTDDSSVCRAAVHAGLIGWDGGRVAIEPRPGEESYRGTTRNGVETSDYGSWGGSFTFVK